MSEKNLVDKMPDKCGESASPASHVGQEGANSSIPPPWVRADEPQPTSWQAVRSLLVAAFELCRHPAFADHELLTERDRVRARRAAIKEAKARVEENPAIFDLWCRKAETLARADEVRFFLESEMLNPDDEESRLITLAWLNFGGTSREWDFCDAEYISQIDLRRHVRRCCAAILRQLAIEPTKKPAPVDHLRERDGGYRGEPVVAAGRSYPGNDRGERLRFYDGARDNGVRYEIVKEKRGDRIDRNLDHRSQRRGASERSRLWHRGNSFRVAAHRCFDAAQDRSPGATSG